MEKNIVFQPYNLQAVIGKLAFEFFRGMWLCLNVSASFRLFIEVADFVWHQPLYFKADVAF